MKTPYIEEKHGIWTLWVPRDTGFAPQIVGDEKTVKYIYETYKKDLE